MCLITFFAAYRNMHIWTTMAVHSCIFKYNIHVGCLTHCVTNSIKDSADCTRQHAQPNITITSSFEVLSPISSCENLTKQ